MAHVPGRPVGRLPAPSRACPALPRAVDLAPAPAPTFVGWVSRVPPAQPTGMCSGGLRSADPPYRACPRPVARRGRNRREPDPDFADDAEGAGRIGLRVAGGGAEATPQAG